MRLDGHEIDAVTAPEPQPASRLRSCASSSCTSFSDRWRNVIGPTSIVSYPPPLLVVLSAPPLSGPDDRRGYFGMLLGVGEAGDNCMAGE